MNRVDKLKRLKNEVNHLFHKGFNVNAVVDQLRSDEQFADISFEQVQAFYSYFQEKSSVEEENERQIAEKDRQIEEHQRILAHLQQIEENQWQIAEHEQELVSEQQMKTEIELMVKYQQNARKFLIYDGSFVNQVAITNFWQGRFFVTIESSDAIGDVYTIIVQDLLQGARKSFTIQKMGRLCGIYALKFPFVLFREIYLLDRVTYFRLATFDFERDSLETVQSFEFNGFRQVLVSTSDVSKFLLQRENNVNQCKLTDDKILIGKKFVLETDFNIYCGSYFDKQLYSLQFRTSSENPFRNRQLTQVKMLLYDLERNEHSTQKLDSTSENFHCLDAYDPNHLAWLHDTIFVTVQFSLTRNHGVIFTNPQVRNWKIIEFATDLEFNQIQSFADGTLMICSEEEEKRKRRIYKLQMRKPDFLRNMAWIAIVKLLKEAKINNPYEEAREYLPFNSEIQPFIFTED